MAGLGLDNAVIGKVTSSEVELEERVDVEDLNGVAEFLDYHLVDLVLPAATTSRERDLLDVKDESDDIVAAAVNRSFSSGRVEQLLKDKRDLETRLEKELHALNLTRSDNFNAGLELTKNCVKRFAVLKNEASANLSKLEVETERANFLKEEIGPLLRELSSFECVIQYGKWALLLSKAEQARVDESLFNEPLALVGEVCAAYHSYATQFKPCSKLENLMIEDQFILNFHDIVDLWRRRYTNELAAALKKLEWPISLSNPTLNISSDSLECVKSAVDNLLQLQLYDMKFGEIERKNSVQGPEQLDQAFWFIEGFLKPITTRFMFHFSGNRETNRIDMPNWYHSFVLHAIQEHGDFLSTHIQPVINELFEKNELGLAVDVQMLFCKGLILVLHSHYERKWIFLKQSNSLLCNTVDEAVLFVKFLYDSVAYRRTGLSDSMRGAMGNAWPTALSFFEAENVRFLRWLEADLEFGRKKLIMEFEKSSSWSTLNDLLHVDRSGKSKLGIEFDQTRDESTTKPGERLNIPDVSVSFLSILSAIFSRVSMLSSLEARLLYIRVVFLALIDEFCKNIEERIEFLGLSILKTIEIDESKMLHAIDDLVIAFNGGIYVSEQIALWKEEELFVSVSEYQRVYDEGGHSPAQGEGSSDDALFLPGVSTSRKFLKKALLGTAGLQNMFRKMVVQTDGLPARNRLSVSKTEDCSILNNACMQLEKLTLTGLESSLCEVFIVKYSLNSLKEFRDTVAAGEYCTGQEEPLRSSAFEAVVGRLIERANYVCGLALPKLAVIFIEALARCVCALLVSVIDSARFDSFGACRLSNDLVYLYNGFKKWARRPENRYFRRLKDRAVILSQPSTKVIFIRNTFMKLTVGYNGDMKSSEGEHLTNMLEDGFGVCSLSLEEVLAISQQRIDT